MQTTLLQLFISLLMVAVFSTTHGDEQTHKDPAAKDTRAERKSRGTWIVGGRITDSEGAPLQMVKVEAYVGWLTAKKSGETFTDKDGRYEAEFSGLPGVQPIGISVRKSGYVRLGIRAWGARSQAEADRSDSYRNSKSIPLFLPCEARQIDVALKAEPKG